MDINILVVATSLSYPLKKTAKSNSAKKQTDMSYLNTEIQCCKVCHSHGLDRRAVFN